MKPFFHPEKELRNAPCFFLVALLMVLALVVAGCGLKSNPQPKSFASPGLIRDMSVETTGEGPLLKWRLAGLTDAAGSFRVERAQLDLVCPSCPVKYELVATPARVAVSDQEKSGAYRFIDRGAKTGSAYRWRISACNDRGRCGEGATVE